jgi:hypothetical protein
MASVMVTMEVLWEGHLILLVTSITSAMLLSTSAFSAGTNCEKAIFSLWRMISALKFKNIGNLVNFFAGSDFGFFAPIQKSFGPQFLGSHPYFASYPVAGALTGSREGTCQQCQRYLPAATLKAAESSILQLSFRKCQMHR